MWGDRAEGVAGRLHERVPSERLLALAEAVGRFHASTSRLRPEGGHEADPLTIRLDELSDELAGRLQGLRAGVRDRADGARRSIASGWLDVLPGALDTAREASLALPGDGASRVVLCHGDLWPAHAHFRGNAFAGFTNFEAMAFAPPTLDLAQLVAHFGGWDFRAKVVHTYERLAPLEEQHRAALPLEVVADLAGEGLWSLKALYAGSSTGPMGSQRTAHEHNLRVLLGCLDKLLEEGEALRGDA